MVPARPVLTVGLILALLSAPLAADTQQPGKVYRIGILWSGSRSAADVVARLDVFRQALRELGYVEGQNIRLEQRYAEGRAEVLPDLAGELVSVRVDVIVSSSTPAIRAAKEATSTIPIVMAGLADPLGAGLVASLAQPGKNITGLSLLTTDVSGKRLELLKEAAPKVSRVAVLWNPNQPYLPLAWRETQVAAHGLGISLFSVEVRGPEDFRSAFAAMLKERVGGLSVLPDFVTFVHRAQIAELAAKHRLPAMYGFREFVEAGGLMSYGASYNDLFRRTASYVDKILKGAKPADLPVEQPTKFELVVNLRTAKTLGLTIPRSVLGRADEIIR